MVIPEYLCREDGMVVTFLDLFLLIITLTYDCIRINNIDTTLFKFFYSYHKKEFAHYLDCFIVCCVTTFPMSRLFVNYRFVCYQV